MGDIVQGRPDRRSRASSSPFSGTAAWTPGDDFLNPQPWAEDALCAQTDPEAFFPEKGGSTREAKKICASCKVAEQCLAYAIENDERFGIWGGLSQRERRRLIRARRAS